MTTASVVLDAPELTAVTRRELARLRLAPVGFIFQHVYLLRNLSLIDIVVLPAYLAGLAPRHERNERALALMERAGVADLADRDVAKASGGPLQGFGICRARPLSALPG